MYLVNFHVVTTFDESRMLIQFKPSNIGYFGPSLKKAIAEVRRIRRMCFKLQSFQSCKLFLCVSRDNVFDIFQRVELDI